MSQRKSSSVAFQKPRVLSLAQQPKGPGMKRRRSPPQGGQYLCVKEHQKFVAQR